MQASIVDLRYNMKAVLSALERNEVVQVLYRGKIKATMIPNHANKEGIRVSEHAFFGMDSSDSSVEGEMRQLRGGRFNAI